MTNDTIPARFERQAAAYGREPLFHVKQDGAYRPISWAQAREDVRGLAHFLLHRKIAPGDRVVLLSENRPEWGLTDLATQSVGAWTVPIYPTLGFDDVRLICQDCQPVIAVASSPDQAQKLFEVAKTVTSLRAVIIMDSGAAAHALGLSWADALAQGAAQHGAQAAVLDARRQALRPDDTATLIYTSGTTGEPKGVMLSHQNFLSNVAACLEVIPLSHSDLHLSFLPLCHVFERMAGWYLMMTAGAAVAFADSMDTLPQNMLEVRPTVMLGVPRFFEKLYARINEGIRQAPPLRRRLAEWALGVGRAVTARLTAGGALPPRLAIQRLVADRLVYHKFKDKLGGRLRFFVSGSAPLSRDVAEFFFSAGVTILEGYGLTETSPVISVNRLPVPRFGSVGPLLPGVEVRIAEDGEILTKGPHVMQGYYRKPDATAAAIVDGWFHTGDIGHLDRGCLVITDRKKDLIKTAGGKFIAPQKLENLLVTDPYISQAFVYGDRQPYCVALIVPNVQQLRRHAQEQEIPSRSIEEMVRDPRITAFYWDRVQAKQQGLAPFEQVKKIALLGQEFSQASGELTPTMKAKRGIIAERYGAALRALYQAAGV